MACKVNRNVVRETNFAARSRPIILRLREGGNYIDVREKGRRKWYSVPVGVVFWRAVQMAADELRKQKKLEREQRRKERQK